MYIVLMKEAKFSSHVDSVTEIIGMMNVHGIQTLKLENRKSRAAVLFA